MATRTELLANVLINRYDKLDSDICALLQREVETICEKWGLVFTSGMGTYIFNFDSECVLIECFEHNGEPYTTDLCDGDAMNDEHTMNLLKDSELSELYEEITALQHLAERLSTETEKNNSEWFLCCLNDVSGFVYNNGYQNPKPKNKKQYYTNDALADLEEINSKKQK